MEGKRNLCAQIPISLHTKVREEQEKTGKSLSGYIASVLTEYFENKENEKGGMNMSGKTRTLAFQVSEELFQRVKTYLAGHPRLSQKDFVVKLIEQAVTEWEAEQARQAEDTPDENEPVDAGIAEAAAEGLDEPEEQETGTEENGEDAETATEDPDDASTGEDAESPDGQEAETGSGEETPASGEAEPEQPEPEQGWSNGDSWNHWSGWNN